MQGPDRPVSEQIEVPEVGAIRGEDQPVTAPAGLDGRFAGSAGDRTRISHAPGIGRVPERSLEPPDGEDRRVPRHGGMVPRHPGQPVVARQLGCGVEVGSLGKDHHRVPRRRRGTVEGHRDEAGDRLPVLGHHGRPVVLADGEHQTAFGVDQHVAVPGRLGRCEGAARPGSVHRVQPAVGQLGEDNDALVDAVLAAAVFVDPGADVGLGRAHLDRVATGERRPPQTHPAALVGVRLQPVEVASVHLRRGQADGGAGQILHADGGRPGSVGSSGHHRLRIGPPAPWC